MSLLFSHFDWFKPEHIALRRSQSSEQQTYCLHPKNRFEDLLLIISVLSLIFFPFFHQLILATTRKPHQSHVSSICPQKNKILQMREREKEENDEEILERLSYRWDEIYLETQRWLKASDRYSWCVSSTQSTHSRWVNYMCDRVGWCDLYVAHYLWLLPHTMQKDWDITQLLANVDWLILLDRIYNYQTSFKCFIISILWHIICLF